MRTTSASCASSPPSNRNKRLVGPLVRSIGKVNDLLLLAYGPRPFRSRGNPLDVLIQTILSQNTSDTNSSRAFLRLRQRFPSWERVAKADPPGIEKAISVGGLGAIKSHRIKRVLWEIEEKAGSFSLDFLKDLPVNEAMDYLCSLDGVGRKTASCVLLFALHKPVFPVDTHVNRIAQRLGWVPLGLSAEKTASFLDGVVPAEMKYALHLDLVAHGRAICRARNPNCGVCPLLGLCPRVGVA